MHDDKGVKVNSLYGWALKVSTIYTGEVRLNKKFKSIYNDKAICVQNSPYFWAVVNKTKLKMITSGKNMTTGLVSWNTLAQIPQYEKNQIQKKSADQHCGVWLPIRKQYLSRLLHKRYFIYSLIVCKVLDSARELQSMCP